MSFHWVASASPDFPSRLIETPPKTLSELLALEKVRPASQLTDAPQGSQNVQKKTRPRKRRRKSDDEDDDEDYCILQSTTSSSSSSSADKNCVYNVIHMRLKLEMIISILNLSYCNVVVEDPIKLKILLKIVQSRQKGMKMNN